MSNQVLENQIIEEKEISYDTSDKEQVNKQRKRSARKRADRLKFIEAAMQHEEGRAWFYDILVYCKIFHTPFNEDPYITSFNCGMANVGIRLLDDIQTAAPDKYLSMINENKSKKE